MERDWSSTGRLATPNCKYDEKVRRVRAAFRLETFERVVAYGNSPGDYALFAALKDYHAGASWDTWEPKIAARQPGALLYWQAKLADEIRYYEYTQYLFFSQWTALKNYANRRGVRIIGTARKPVAYDAIHKVIANAEAAE